jgi:hypothetical protein
MTSAIVHQLKAAPKRAAPKSRRAHKALTRVGAALYIDVHGRAA